MVEAPKSNFISPTLKSNDCFREIFSYLPQATSSQWIRQLNQKAKDNAKNLAKIAGDSKMMVLEN
jgi:hypothetical protein